MTREDEEAIIIRLEAMYGEAEENETKEALFYAIEALKEKPQSCKTCLFWNSERTFCERWAYLMGENSFCSRHKCVYDTEEYEAMQWEREWAKEHESGQ